MSTGHPPAALMPPAEWSDLDSRAHSVQFYTDDAVLVDEVSCFIGSALGAGAAGIVIATAAHREGIERRLTARGLDVARARTQGRYVSLDAAETLSAFMLDGWPHAARFADRVGGIIARATAARSAYPRAAMFGEMVALLWAQGKPEAALRLEQLWNDLAQTHAFHLRCAYPMSLFSGVGDGEPMGQICDAHARVIPAESYTSLIDEEERLRTVTLLQQKAQALVTEIEEHRKAQLSLERREAELADVLAEHKRMEQALRERNQELREAVAARDEFLSVAAHELKTPVTSLQGFVQLLLRDARRQREIAPERLTSALDTVELQTGKLTHLVARLLDTAQIEAGKLRIEPARTDLVALVQAALTRQHGGANRTFVFDGPAHLEAMVDPIRFEQVITHLLDNAVKFSPDGGSVTVGLGQSDDGGIRLSVTDHGVGVPSDEREDVFERFHEAHGRRHLSGLGLGLYIARQIVELHGGLVRIEEPEHRGSRFVVTLPPSAGGAPTGPAA